MTTQILSQPVQSPFSSFMRKMYDSWVQRTVRMQTERELHALSDRELNDIGISRYMISSIARGVSDARK